MLGAETKRHSNITRSYNHGVLRTLNWRTAQLSKEVLRNWRTAQLSKEVLRNRGYCEHATGELPRNFDFHATGELLNFQTSYTAQLSSQTPDKN